MKGSVIFSTVLVAFPLVADAALPGLSGNPARGAYVPDMEKSGFFDGSLVGSIFFDSEFTGIGMADIIVFAVLAFLLLSILRSLRSSQEGRRGSDAVHREAPRHTLPPTQRSSSEHDPWARLRSKDVPSPRSAPRPGQPSNSVSGPNQGSRPQHQYQNKDVSSAQGLPVRQAGPEPALGEGQYPPAALNLRRDFDLEDFLKGARILFARLQESFDRRDFEDMALFATPEVVEEMRDQAEQEGVSTKTEILLVKASLISLNVEDAQEVAEVFFDVLLREGNAPSPLQVKEIWYFVHPAEGGFWQLDGIRQVD